LYLDSDWEDIPVRAGLWTNSVDDRGPADGPWAILEFTTSGSNDYVGWRAWASGLGWQNLENVSFDYDTWNTLSIVLDVPNQKFIFYVNGEQVFITDSDQLGHGDATYFNMIVLNSYNYGLEGGDDYDVHWSLLGNVLDWYVTTDTHFILSCNDVGPHPSGHETAYWTISRTTDGDVWEVIEEGSQLGGHEFSFAQTSFHKLEWYCEDAVEKRSETSIQYSKLMMKHQF
jgi:hypothetical protein